MQLRPVTQQSSKANNGNDHYEVNMMELDDQNQVWEDAMETEEKSVYQVAYDELLQQTLEYGRALQAEFADDPRREVKRALDEVFSLWAYEDPITNKAVSHLLDRKGRVEVSEELNAAILSTSITLFSLFPILYFLCFPALHILESYQLISPSLPWQTADSSPRATIPTNTSPTRRSRGKWWFRCSPQHSGRYNEEHLAISRSLHLDQEEDTRSGSRQWRGYSNGGDLHERLCS